jgi:hypothetical protein
MICSSFCICLESFLRLLCGMEFHTAVWYQVVWSLRSIRIYAWLRQVFMGPKICCILKHNMMSFVRLKNISGNNVYNLNLCT